MSDSVEQPFLCDRPKLTETDTHTQITTVKNDVAF